MRLPRAVALVPALALSCFAEAGSGSTDGGSETGGTSSSAGGDGSTSTTGTAEATGADGGGSGSDASSTSGGEGSTSDADTTATSGGTGSPGGASCTVDDDCVLVSDCCGCRAAAAADDPEECPGACPLDRCAVGGVDAVTCLHGTCTITKRSCDPSKLMCRRASPECEPGTVPEIDVEVGCYTDACVPLWACDVVPGCSDCLEHELCAVEVAQLGPTHRCIQRPEACGSQPATCTCAGELCEPPFDTCADGDGTLSCQCIACG
jgi:hypothetical protein